MKKKVWMILLAVMLVFGLVMIGCGGGGGGDDPCECGVAGCDCSSDGDCNGDCGTAGGSGCTECEIGDTCDGTCEDCGCESDGGLLMLYEDGEWADGIEAVVTWELNNAASTEAAGDAIKITFDPPLDATGYEGVKVKVTKVVSGNNSSGGGQVMDVDETSDRYWDEDGGWSLVDGLFTLPFDTIDESQIEEIVVKVWSPPIGPLVYVELYGGPVTYTRTDEPEPDPSDCECDEDADCDGDCVECDCEEEGGPIDPPAAWTTGEKAATPIDVTLECNGENDDGNAINQLVWNPEWLFTGRKITEGDTFTLSAKIKFDDTVDSFTFGFLDNSEAAGYWRELTDWDDAEEGVFNETLAANTEKDILVRFTAIASAEGLGNSNNRMFIMIEREANSCNACHEWMCGDADANSGWGNPDNAQWCSCQPGGVGNCECDCQNPDIELTFTSLKIWSGHGEEPAE